MGDWRSEGCDRKPKEISAEVEMLVTQQGSLARKNKFSRTGQLFPLDKGLLMGDPIFPSSIKARIRFRIKFL
jgi:hypothetical protein